MSLTKEIITSDKAPKAIGPYSIANRVGNLVFTAGQVGIIPETGDIVTGGIEAETHQVFENLKHVLAAAGTTLDHVVKTTVFLRDMADFATVNGIYGQYFTGNYPARSTVQVAALPKNAAVEIEVIALVP